MKRRSGERGGEKEKQMVMGNDIMAGRNYTTVEELKGASQYPFYCPASNCQRVGICEVVYCANQRQDGR